LRNISRPSDLIASREYFAIVDTLLIDGQNLFVRQ